VLDSREWHYAFRNWDIRKQNGADKLWHDYLVFRSRDKRDESVACYVEMRRVVDALVQHQQGEIHNDSNALEWDWDQVLDKLCWLALEREWDETFGNRIRGWGHLSSSVWRDQWWKKWNGSDDPDETDSEPANFDLKMLSAATYLGYIPLVRGLLGQGCDPRKHDEILFPSAMYIAAWTGQADMVQLLQENLPATKYPPNNFFWHSKANLESICGAAALGNIDLLQLCVHPLSPNIPGYNLDTGKPLLGFLPGEIPCDSTPGIAIAYAMRRTNSVQVYNYLSSLLDETKPRDIQRAALLRNQHLLTVSSTGNIPLLDHLLTLGADLSHRPIAPAHFGTALALAARTCNFDVVDFLLSRGADPNRPGYFPGTALTSAIQSGSMVMVKKLLDAGADVGFPDVDRCNLKCAVMLEHGEMVELLLDLGGGTEIGMAYALWTAEELGLESMSALLRGRGARLVPWVNPGVGSGVGGSSVTVGGTERAKVDESMERGRHVWRACWK